MYRKSFPESRRQLTYPISTIGIGTVMACIQTAAHTQYSLGRSTVVTERSDSVMTQTTSPERRW